MEKVQKISGGRVKVGPGTLYTMLSKFEENQIIFRTKEEGRRKSYVITEHGRKLLQEEHERLCIMLADWNGYFDKKKDLSIELRYDILNNSVFIRI